jgi:hypothetical protein
MKNDWLPAIKVLLKEKKLENIRKKKGFNL